MDRLVYFLAGALLLAGCTDNHVARADGQVVPLGALPGGAPASHDGDGGQSWMLPEAKRDDLVYTSDMNRREVFVLSIPSGKLVGTFAFHDIPWGLCAEKSGNVFITTSTSANHVKRGAVTEYAHGSLTPIVKLQVSKASACAVDPKSGDLAVSGGLGGFTISIFSPPWRRGGIRRLGTRSLEAEVYLSYDDKGDLFFPTVQYSAGNRLFELPYDGANPIVVKLLGNESDGGPLQWHGTYLASEIDRIGGEAVEHIRAPRGSGHVIGLTTLAGGGMDFGGNQFWIDRDEIASPFGYSGGLDDRVGLWSYPAGSQIAVFGGFGAQFLTGVTISRVTK